jgi:hypothetical protein
LFSCTGFSFYCYYLFIFFVTGFHGENDDSIFVAPVLLVSQDARWWLTLLSDSGNLFIDLYIKTLKYFVSAMSLIVSLYFNAISPCFYLFLPYCFLQPLLIRCLKWNYLEFEENFCHTLCLLMPIWWNQIDSQIPLGQFWFSVVFLLVSNRVKKFDCNSFISLSDFLLFL